LNAESSGDERTPKQQRAHERRALRDENQNPVGDTGDDGDLRAPAKPPQRPGHHCGDDFAARRRVERGQERCRHQIEEVEQTDPGDAGEDVDPAQGHLDVRVPTARKKNGSLG
jgi:hypothetical protein